MRKTKVVFDNDQLAVSSEILRALCHPLRLKIIGFIDQHKSINVNKIYNTLKLEQSITSQHLRILRNSNLVNTNRDGKFIHYSLNYKEIEKANKAVVKFLEESSL
ncbi:MAG: metalloregulator ArsR/SmtB family transcription factor [Bacteroidia bacterium]|nr:metalloregulator ArsR/SmtB family transcription factor [Bacteroidia bacterium]